MVESWISLYLRCFVALLVCANRFKVTNCLQDKTTFNSSVETALEPTGILTLVRYLVTKKKRLEESKKKMREYTK